MEVITTDIPGILILKPKVFHDDRGFFKETFNTRTYEQLGLPTQFVQDNLSLSHRGVLRGLHYQIQQAQGKLIQVMLGEIFDVVVDLRRPSPYFGKWLGIVLSEENHYQLWIPPGFAHGFYVLSDKAEVVYKVTDFWAPEWEQTLLWNDPDLAIEWPIRGQAPILSQKDQGGKPLSQAVVYE